MSQWRVCLPALWWEVSDNIDDTRLNKEDSVMENDFGNQHKESFFEEYNERTNLNECTIKGFCSVDPIIYSLLEVLLYELKQLTYYYIKIL